MVLSHLHTHTHTHTRVHSNELLLFQLERQEGGKASGRPCETGAHAIFCQQPQLPNAYLRSAWARAYKSILRWKLTTAHMTQVAMR